MWQVNCFSADNTCYPLAWADNEHTAVEIANSLRRKWQRVGVEKVRAVQLGSIVIRESDMTISR